MGAITLPAWVEEYGELAWVVLTSAADSADAWIAHRALWETLKQIPGSVERKKVDDMIQVVDVEPILPSSDYVGRHSVYALRPPRADDALDDVFHVFTVSDHDVDAWADRVTRARVSRLDPPLCHAFLEGKYPRLHPVGSREFNYIAVPTDAFTRKKEICSVDIVVSEQYLDHPNYLSLEALACGRLVVDARHTEGHPRGWEADHLLQASLIGAAYIQDDHDIDDLIAHARNAPRAQEFVDRAADHVRKVHSQTMCLDRIRRVLWPRRHVGMPGAEK